MQELIKEIAKLKADMKRVCEKYDIEYMAMCKFKNDDTVGLRLQIDTDGDITNELELEEVVKNED